MYKRSLNVQSFLTVRRAHLELCKIPLSVTHGFNWATCWLSLTVFFRDDVTLYFLSRKLAIGSHRGLSHVLSVCIVGQTPLCSRSLGKKTSSSVMSCHCKILTKYFINHFLSIFYHSWYHFRRAMKYFYGQDNIVSVMHITPLQLVPFLSVLWNILYGSM